MQPGGRRSCDLTVVSSYGKAVVIGGEPVIIGERINPTGKPRLKQAILDADLDYICRLGLEQLENDAHILDVNVGVPGINEAAAAEKEFWLCRPSLRHRCRSILQIMRLWSGLCVYIMANRC